MRSNKLTIVELVNSERNCQHNIIHRLSMEGIMLVGAYFGFIGHSHITSSKLKKLGTLPKNR